MWPCIYFEVPLYVFRSFIYKCRIARDSIPMGIWNCAWRQSNTNSNLAAWRTITQNDRSQSTQFLFDLSLQVSRANSIRSCKRPNYAYLRKGTFLCLVKNHLSKNRSQEPYLQTHAYRKPSRSNSISKVQPWILIELTINAMSSGK